MRRQQYLPALSLGALLVSVAADATTEPDPDWSADSSPDSSELATMLSEVVVTATRYAEGVESVPANVSVITKEKIANSTARDVPGILENEVGLHVYELTGNGRNYRVDRSGFGETAGLNTLVLVDGRRVNNPDLAGADWTLIPLDRVSRIEIVRGSRGSVLYGDNATDGVINIITQQGRDDLRFGVEAAGGSDGTMNPSGYVSGTQNGLSYALSGRYYQSNGYRDNSQTQQGDVGLNLDYALGDSGRIGLSAGYHEDETGLPGALRLSDRVAGIDRRGTTHPFDFADTEDYYVQLDPEIDFLDSSAFKIPVSYRRRTTEFFSSFVGGEYLGNTATDTVIASPQAIVRKPIAGLDNTLTVGFDYYRGDEEIGNRSEFFGSIDVGRFDLRKKSHGVYLYDEIYPIDALSLSAGYRWDKVAYAFSPTAPGTRDTADYDANVLTAGMSYQVLDRSYLYLSFAEGFRYPVLDEIFNFFTNTINADLRPQTSDNIEIGLRHFFNDSLYANINLFRLDTNDEIFFNPVTYSNENLDAETRREGVEVSAGYDGAELSVSATYTHRETEIRGGIFSGNAVPNVPRNQASLNVVWRPLAGLTLALNGLYVGERYLESDYGNDHEKQDDYKVVNIKVKYAWQKYTAFLDLNNVFDETYSAYGVLSTFPVEPAFYPSPEFNLFAGIRFDY